MIRRGEVPIVAVFTLRKQVEQKFEFAQAVLSFYGFDPSDSQSTAVCVTDSSVVVQESARKQGALSKTLNNPRDNWCQTRIFQEKLGR